jgi:CDP-glucose 4,6-dehydratase
VSTLITGVTGFVGGHLARRLLDEGERVVGIVRDLTRAFETLDRRIIVVLGNVRDFSLLKRVISEYSVDQCYHFAAQSLVRVAQRNPVETFEVNVGGTVALLEACRLLDVKRTYIASTDKIYGERINASEEDPLSPTGPYEASKCAQDLAAQSFMRTYNMGIVVGRACNLYGPMDENPRIIPNVIRQCLAGQRPIIYTFAEEPSREYLYIDDFLDAVQLLMNSDRRGVYNIGSGEVKTQSEVVTTIARHFGVEPHHKPALNYMMREIKRQSLSSQKIFRETGWKAKTTFSEGIRRTVEWFRSLQ